MVHQYWGDTHHPPVGFAEELHGGKERAEAKVWQLEGELKLERKIRR